MRADQVHEMLRSAQAPEFENEPHRAELRERLLSCYGTPAGRALPARPPRPHRLRYVAAAAALAVLILVSVFQRTGAGIAWADVAESMARVVQFHLTAFIQEAGQEVRVDIYHRQPGSWRAQGGGTVQFLRTTVDGPEVRFYDVDSRSFVARQDARLRPLPDDVRALSGPDMLSGVLGSLFGDEVPAAEPVRAQDDSVSSDLVVFDYARQPKEFWARVWVLKESRLPLRVKVVQPMSNEETVAFFDYSDPQPDRFFDPDAFAAEVSARRLTRPGDVYRAGQGPVGEKPRSAAQVHDMEGYRPPKPLEVVAYRDGDLKIVAEGPRNRHPNGSVARSEYEKEIWDSWGNCYLRYFSRTETRANPPSIVQYYMPVAALRRGEGEHTVTLRYVIHKSGSTEIVVEYEQEVAVPQPSEDAVTDGQAADAFWKHQATWHYLREVGTVPEKLAFLEPLLADPDGPSYVHAVAWKMNLLQGFEGRDAAFRLFEQTIKDRAIAGAIGNDTLGRSLADYLFYLLDSGRSNEIDPILRNVKASADEALKTSNRHDVERLAKHLAEKPYGVYVALGIPESVRERQDGPKPRLARIVHSRDGHVLMEFDRLGAQINADAQPEWGRYPDVEPSDQWKALLTLFKDGKLLVVAVGNGAALNVVFHPILCKPERSQMVPRIRWPISVELPPASAGTLEEALAEDMPEWRDLAVKALGPSPSEAGRPEPSPFVQATKAADDLFAGGKYPEAMQLYLDAAAMAPAELPDYARHPANEGAAEGLLRKARLDAVKCMIELGQLDRAETELDEIEKDRPDLRAARGRDEWETRDKRARAALWWRLCDSVRWMLLKAHAALPGSL